MSLPVSTFSIAGCDPDSGDVGVAVASKFLAVGAVVPWAEAGVGAVATQSYANTSYGPDGLHLLARGLSPDDVVRQLTVPDKARDQRQLGIVAADGRSATFTGEACVPWAGGLVGECYAIQGNILVGPEVAERMRESFTSSTGPLGDRLLRALGAGDAAGGDSRGRQSAALLVVRQKGGYGGFNDRYIDLRVDDHRHPIEELGRLRQQHRLYFDPVREEDATPLTPSLIEEVTRILEKSGDLEAVGNRDYDTATKDRLRGLFSRENLEERWRDDATIDRVALDYLRDRYR